MFFPVEAIYETTQEIVEMTSPLAWSVRCPSIVTHQEFKNNLQYDLLGWAEFGYPILATKKSEVDHLNSAEIDMHFREFEYSDVQTLFEISVASVVNRKGLSHLYSNL